MIVRVGSSHSFIAGQSLFTNMTNVAEQVNQVVKEETATKGWVAQQIEEILVQIGDSISSAITNAIDHVIDSLQLGSVYLLEVGAMVIVIWAAYQLMFGVNREKQYSRIILGLLLYVIAVVVKVRVVLL